MQQTLVVLGIACIIAAVIGGGLRLARIVDIPLISSVHRQALLAIVGLLSITAGIVMGGYFRDLTPSGSVASQGSTSASSAVLNSCLVSYFQGIPQDRIAKVEAGTNALDVIREDQPKEGTVGLEFTDFGDFIGAVRFRFFPSNELFKIESVADAQCRVTDDFSNYSRPASDKHVLPSDDTLRLTLAGQSYLLHFGRWHYNPP